MASRILLADDSITIQKVVNLTFADEGIEVVSVSNGDAAERRLPEVDPDLVLADIFMPGKNGYELCETIKAVPQYKDLPVVLLVGAFEPYNEVEARRVKADGHLTKPFESRVLVDLVRNLIASHPRKRETPSPQPTAPQPSAVTQPFSPILRPESNLDFAAMSDQIAPQPVPNPPDYFQNEPTFEVGNAGQGHESPIEFVTSPPDNEATLPFSNINEAHNQLKPALPDAADHQADWSFNSGANAVVDYEKVEPAGASMNNSLPALEVDSVSPVDAAESSAASQQAFITILTEPSGQPTGEVSEGEPKKFDTSELPTPESEEGGKKFDTNELETPAATATETAASVPQPQPAATEPAVSSFGFEGVSEEEPLGDVLKGTMPLPVYEAGEEHSPLEIEEPVVAKPPIPDEAQIAGSPLNVGAFVDVAALRAQQDASQTSGSASEQAASGAETGLHAEATAAPETGFNVVAATPFVEATAPLSTPPAPAESTSADMWSIGLPTKPPGPDYAPAPPEEASATPTEAKANEAPAAPTIEASQAVIDEIVRRVVTQLSDNVVREIAWEVVPDCVERVVSNLTKEKMAENK